MIKRILFFALSWGLSVCAFAQNPMEEYLADSASVTRKANFSDEKHFYGVKKAEGDSAYMKNDYVSAIQIYESLLQEGEAAEVYYNLGNSYYKTDNIGKAILNYERALLLQPDNGDIRTNLEIARSKTVDKTTPIPEIFFVTWIRSLINVLSMDAWAKSGIVFFILLLISLSFFLLSKQVWKKKTGFIAGTISLLLVLLSNIFAFNQKRSLTIRNQAIVVLPSITVRSTPSESGTSLFILHEGHKVCLKDDSMREWKEIRLEDGKVGWVSASDIEII